MAASDKSLSIQYGIFPQEKVTIELIQILEEEERRWAQALHIEDYQSHLARSVIQVRHPLIDSRHRGISLEILALYPRFTIFFFYFIQRLKVDLDRSTAVNQFLGARVARCSLTGLANFLYR